MGGGTARTALAVGHSQAAEERHGGRATGPGRGGGLAGPLIVAVTRGCVQEDVVHISPGRGCSGRVRGGYGLRGQIHIGATHGGKVTCCEWFLHSCQLQSFQVNTSQYKSMKRNEDKQCTY